VNPSVGGLSGASDANDTDEARCIARAKAGDAKAFERLVRTHQGYLRKLLCRVCRGDQARADDLAQEAFVRAWRALPNFRGEARFRTWLTRLAYSSLSAERPGLAYAEPAEDEDALQSDFAPAVDRRLDLERAMESLSEPQRHALLLTYGSDLSHAEAAQVLGWPLGTLKTQVLRAKAKLRDQLTHGETPND
jgi:RNA polymerase sigma-70 factor, ECF subfamily